MADVSALPDCRITPVAFADLAGWRDDDHRAALAAFRRGATVLAEHPPRRRALGVDAEGLARALRRAAAMEPPTAAAARTFFEDTFTPMAVTTPSGDGFFTGYYEPEVEGSLARNARFTVPLYRTPDDLVAFDPNDPPPGFDPSLRFARKGPEGFSEYPDRAAIMAGALAGRGLEIAWLADPVDAFFIQVQGAARIRLADGSLLRITYAAKTGHPYTAIGKVLIDMAALAPGEVTMQGIRAWLADHPGERDAVLARNRSYVFFREAPVADPVLGPIAAAKVPLTAGRSLAVDRLLHSFHMPVWVETTLPSGQSFRRLIIAQDTGSAIVGPARGDIFFGSGDAAGAVAGAMQAAGRFVMLVPRTTP